MTPPGPPSPSRTSSPAGRRRWRAPTRRTSWATWTWTATSPLPPGPTGSASSLPTRTAASHEREGAPGADRYRRPRRRAVPRAHAAAPPRHGQLGRPHRLAHVADARRRLGGAAGSGGRVGARRLPAPGQALVGADGPAPRGAPPAAAPPRP